MKPSLIDLFGCALGPSVNEIRAEEESIGRSSILRKIQRERLGSKKVARYARLAGAENWQDYHWIGVQPPKMKARRDQNGCQYVASGRDFHRQCFVFEEEGFQWGEPIPISKTLMCPSPTCTVSLESTVALEASQELSGLGLTSPTPLTLRDTLDSVVEFNVTFSRYDAGYAWVKPLLWVITGTSTSTKFLHNTTLSTLRTVEAKFPISLHGTVLAAYGYQNASIPDALAQKYVRPTYLRYYNEV